MSYRLLGWLEFSWSQTLSTHGEGPGCTQEAGLQGAMGSPARGALSYDNDNDDDVLFHHFFHYFSSHAFLVLFFFPYPSSSLLIFPPLSL